jgi:hypothetical protein
MIDKGIKVGFIWGAEKPRLASVDGKYCIRFQDLVDNCVSPLIQQNEFPGWYDELFYWSPEFTQGLIKQAHIIRRGLGTLPFNQINFCAEFQPFGSVIRNNAKWYLTNHGLHQLIYPGWDIGTFSVGKKRSPILSLRDSWYLNKSEGSNLRFLDGIKKFDTILSRVEQGFWKNEQDLMGGVKGCVSRPYFIE